MTTYITPFVDAKIKEVLAKFGDKRMALLPILSIMVREFGKLNTDLLHVITTYTKLPHKTIVEVHEHYYPANKNISGRYKIFVCINHTCAMKQSKEIVDFISSALNIRPGQTTPDGKYSLITLQCLGGCFTPPTVKVNGIIHQNMNKYKTQKLLDELNLAE